MTTSGIPRFDVKAYHGNDPFCFVSYSHQESDRIFGVIRLLSDQGFRIYYDEGIHPGHKWHDDLAQGIKNCHVFILFVTEKSIRSSNCLRELNFALEQEKPVLAIHLEDVELPPGMQLALGDRQAILKSRFEEVDFRARMFAAVADYVGQTPEEIVEPAPPPLTTTAQPKKKIVAKKPMLLVGIPILTLIVVIGSFLFYQHTRIRLSNYETALAEIESLLVKDRFTDAWLIIQGLDPIEDERRSAYAERIVVPGTLQIANAGVAVSFKPYGNHDVDWIPLGLTPFEAEVPLPRGDLHLRLELDGHVPRELVAKNPGPMFGNRIYLELFGKITSQDPIRMAPTGEIPDYMVEVPASNRPLFMTGWSRDMFGQDLVIDTPSFFVSKFEVTNVEYKEFVDAGGYENSEYWRGMEFVEKGKALGFDEARALFVDRTGRRGPSTWEFSSFGEGEADLPVGGISWYEAVAYSRFRGLALPTIYHWARLAYGPIEGHYPLAGAISRQSNFNGDGPVPGVARRGLGPWGTYNTAGNVREWVWNEAGDLGLIQGSSWQSYGNYSQVITAPRMNRHATNGIRLMKSDVREPFDPALLGPIDIIYDDPYTSREPVSDETFEVMRYQFQVPRREALEVVVERVEETDLWTVDEHRLKYSESQTRVIYIFKPVIPNTPHQVVLFGSPANAFVPGLKNRQAINQIVNFDYLLQGGRAVVLPIWANSHERSAPIATDPKFTSANERLLALSWYQDAVDTINYLEGLDDLSTDNLAFLGVSFGAAVFGPLVTALETRIAGSVFFAGGLTHTVQLNPMLDGINYLPRIEKPVLMLNGHYDHIFPWEESSVRSFELLGTPDEHKKLVGYDAGHFAFPRNRMVAEVSDWLDKYMGPVR